MSPNPGTIQIEEPSTTPPPHAYLPPHGFMPSFLGGPPPHNPHNPHHPPRPRSSQTYHVPDYTNPPIPSSSASSLPCGINGGGVENVNRHPSNSSRSARAATPRPSAPGYALDEHKSFGEIADYMSRDGDCILLRRFGVLRFRDMLCKQAQLMEVEHELTVADGAVLCGNGDVETVRGLMRELDIKLKAYDDALDRCHRAYTMPRPSARGLSKTNTWLRTRGFPSYPPGDAQEDLVALDRELITDGPITRLAALIARRVFRKEVSRKAGVNQLSADHAVFVSRALISLIAPLILLVPIVLLCYLHKLWMQILIVMVATVTSSFAMMVAKAGNAEVFMATSAYAAVMVVFLGTVVAGNGNGNGNGGGGGRG